MAWSSGALTAAEVADAAADHVCLAGAQQAEGASVVRWNGTGSFATADDTATGYPGSRAYDRAGRTMTKPATARLAQYLLLDLGSTWAGEVDFVALIGHNAGAISGDGNGALSLNVDIADDSTFATNLQTVWSQTVAADTKNQRLVSTTGTGPVLGISHTGTVALRYTAARFWRLKLSRAAGTFVPQVGELWLARRRQLTIVQLLGSDKDQQRDEVYDFYSQGSSITRYTPNSGQAVKECKFLLPATSERTTIDSWRSECAKTKAGLFIQNPSTAPRAALIMLPTPGIVRPINSMAGTDLISRWEPVFQEQDTFYGSEV